MLYVSVVIWCVVCFSSHMMCSVFQWSYDVFCVSVVLWCVVCFSGRMTCFSGHMLFQWSYAMCFSGHMLCVSVVV